MESHTSPREVGSSSFAEAALCGVSFLAQIHAKHLLPKGHPLPSPAVVHNRRGLRRGHPSRTWSPFSWLFSCAGGNAKPLVVIVRYLTVMRGIVRVPIAGVVAAFAALDADELAGAGEGGEATAPAVHPPAWGRKIPAPFGCSTRPSSKGGHTIHRRHPRKSPAAQSPRTSRPKPVR